MQIRIVKSDGSDEPYLHTKVLGSFNHALSHSEDEYLYAAEQMAEAVTFYLYQQVRQGTLSTDEIHQMILNILISTGHEYAAAALNEHRLKRKLRRKRIEVIDDTHHRNELTVSGYWRKARIVHDLTSEHCIDSLLARAIASSVEEKILNLGLTKIRKSLIHHLVIADMETMLDAHHQLTAV